MDNTKARWPTIEIDYISDKGKQTFQLEAKDGRYVFPFTPTSPKDRIVIKNSSQQSKNYYADLLVRRLQLEGGSTPTAWQSNLSQSTILAKILSDLKSIKIDTTNPENGNYLSFELNGKYIQQYFKDIDGNFSQVEQNARGIKQTVANAQGDISTLYQTAQGWANRWSSTIGDEKSGLIKKVNDIKGTADGLHSEIYRKQDGVLAKINAVTRTSDGTASLVGDLQQGKLTKFYQLKNAIGSIAEEKSPDGTTIVSRINQTPKSVMIKGDNLLLDGNVTMTKGFIVPEGNIGYLKADKIEGGTLDFRDITVLNLNAKDITGFTSQFVRSLWNDIARASSVSIDASGIKTESSSGSVYFRSGGLMFYDNNSRNIGHIGAGYNTENPSEKGIGFRIEPDRYMSWSMKYNESDPDYTTIMTVGFDRGGSVGNRSVRINSWLDMFNSINMHGYDIERIGRLYFNTDKKSYIYEPSSGEHQAGWINVIGNWGVNLGAQRTIYYKFFPDEASFYRSLSMNNYEITNCSNLTQSSDLRLKKVIRDLDGGIEWTKRQRLVEYEWNDNPANKGKDKNRHIGTLAQYAAYGPHGEYIQETSAEGNHYLSVSLNDRVTLNTQTNKELIQKIEALEARVKELEQIGI